MLHLILLFLIAFLVGADEFLLGPILTPIGTDLSVPPERIALFITAYSLPLAIMAPILGGVSDRYGRLAILVPSTLVFGIASIATSFVPTFETGIATRILTGAASGGMLGIAMAMAGDLGEKAAPKAIAFVTSGLTLGIILSPGIGALSAEMWSWRFAFSALGGLALIVVLIGLPSLRTTHAPDNRPNAVAGNMTEPLFVPGTWGSLIAMAFGLGGAVGCFALVGERLRSLYEWDTATVGMVYAAFGILTLVGNFTMPMALARAGSGRALMRIAMAFVAAAIVVTYVFDALGSIMILAALAVWAVLGGMGAPGLQTHIAQLSPARRGALMALAGSSMNLGVAGASALAASIYPAGPVWVAAVGVGLIAVAIVALRPVCADKTEVASAG
ncbi:putative MFS family arabinose efflux permease [Aminobacter niigataensis]|uniref:MFS family arabinose efflux permease n=1 Tax=Aminobacter niigataensis TaxID=83265 RepID=A0ABR6L978_9HYPH|nr:MFS transporter [Aminobacter niigataensis]MBB4653374.1 putative MFS family arabinose efflux permease [Aminobacter niigataensis]